MAFEPFHNRERRVERARNSFKPGNGRPRSDACVHGHRFTAENTYEYTLPDGRVQRKCKACTRDRQQVKRST